MFQLFRLLTRELALYVWTKDYDGFVRRFSNKAVKLNIVYAKVVQAFVVRPGTAKPVARQPRLWQARPSTFSHHRDHPPRWWSDWFVIASAQNL
jgi:hypothetical protein